MSSFYRHPPRSRRLSADDLELAWVMYQEGRLTIAEIASEMAVCSGTLSIYLREYRAAIGGMDFLRSLDAQRGPRTYAGRPAFSSAADDAERMAERRTRAAELRDEGFSQKAIARVLHVSQPTVASDLQAYDRAL